MSRQGRPRWLVPEVIQTSAMDCGPAALTALLQGYRLPISYGRLREACQTNVDGTSINTLEKIAAQWGLDAQQVMLPPDQLLLPGHEALPAIVVVRRADGAPHFIVAWRRQRGLVQIMDPATGRRWVTRQQFLSMVYRHTFPVSASAWREWAASAEFLDVLRQRMRGLAIAAPAAGRLIAQALADPGWPGLATLDAAVRMAEALVRSGGLARGQQAAGVVETFVARSLEQEPGQAPIIPANYWFAQQESAGAAPGARISLRGAVLVRVRGLRAAAAGPAAARPIAPDLAATLGEAPPQPGRELLRLLRADGALAPLALLATIALATLGVVAEALLLRGLIAVGGALGLAGQRLTIIGAVLLVMLAILLAELSIASAALRLGRRIEARLRIAFLSKLPRLGDQYFRSRLTSDMAERSHSLHNVRLAPTLGAQIMRLGLEIILTTAGIIWLAPASAPIALLSAAFALGLPLVGQALVAERDLRSRTHSGALKRFYLDALLGLVAVRAYGAERPVVREYERKLAEWMRSAFSLLRALIGLEFIQALVGFGLAAWLLIDHTGRDAAAGSLLLLLYWALNLPLLGQDLAQYTPLYPVQRNILLRLLEPLGAPEDQQAPAPTDQPPAEQPPGGVAVSMRGVRVQAAGHTILKDVDLELAPGSHIAIVGPSGAGKSSLVGVLLGWHQQAAGEILIDGQPLGGPALQRLRSATAWVDPAVQIWNQSLLENLRYGAADALAMPLSAAIDQADLRTVLEKLPEGLQTPLGEGGGLVSGGEGQRVRLGRAILRPGVRLVILDEPFRGLARQQRRDLLAAARQRWAGATLLCITHDVSETLAFERVLVVEDGRIVEDGSPAALADQADSRYRALLAAEVAIQEQLWSARRWRQIALERGQIVERGQDGGADA